MTRASLDSTSRRQVRKWRCAMLTFNLIPTSNDILRESTIKESTPCWIFSPRVWKVAMERPRQKFSSVTRQTDVLIVISTIVLLRDLNLISPSGDWLHQEPLPWQSDNWHCQKSLSLLISAFRVGEFVTVFHSYLFFMIDPIIASTSIFQELKSMGKPNGLCNFLYCLSVTHIKMYDAFVTLFYCNSRKCGRAYIFRSSLHHIKNF